MKPILSVVVPSYNVEQYLDKGLTSYSDDRFNGRLEIIVVNDGSKDKTQEIAEGYAKRFPNIFKVINKENGGHGSAVNAGIDNATGKYFRIIDGERFTGYGQVMLRNGGRTGISLSGGFRWALGKKPEKLNSTQGVQKSEERNISLSVK